MCHNLIVKRPGKVIAEESGDQRGGGESHNCTNGSFFLYELLPCVDCGALKMSTGTGSGQQGSGLALAVGGWSLYCMVSALYYVVGELHWHCQ